jgi:rod shape determining protein RodA
LPVSSDINHDYNVRQAIISVGAGGLYGRGFGFGTQSQLKFLPEAKTDFIFAVVAEELGFFGVFLVLFFFGLIFFRIFSILHKTKNENAFFFCFSVIGLIFIEMFINIGMNIGLFPVIGIALPFLSYGGSSLVSNLIIMGILQNIIIKSKIK